LFSGTRALLAGLLTTIVLLFFLLVSGDLFLRRLVEILPTLRMWGVAGALLAVPMLATFKIVCDRIRPLMALGHFLGAGARS